MIESGFSIMLKDDERLELARLKSKFDYNLFFNENERIKAQTRINELFDKEKALSQ